ncbi:MAG: thiolase family protein [Verrucomicrobia bacterium]|nr:thiolase family protein [Verrucomicrobiota bacterium]
MTSRVAIVQGIRTPFCKAGGKFRDIPADELGAIVVRELLERSPIKKEEVDEVIFGNVLPNVGNPARVLAVKGGLPITCPAYTISRNCASGMEAVVSGANQIALGKAKIIFAGGTESMSRFPIVFPESIKQFLTTVSKAKTFFQKLKALFSFRFSMFKPVIPQIDDPLCNLIMGQTAENISRELKVTRQEQDAFALLSQQRANAAIKSGRFKEEIVPVPLPPHFDQFQLNDDGPRENQTMEILGALRPAFDRLTGQVTAGNSSQVTDGAACLLLMSEEEVKKRNIPVLGYIRATATVALDPARMGLGPVYAIHKILKENNLTLDQIDLIEINEAFAAQIVAIEKAAQSAEFCKKELGLDHPLGKIDREKLNVNGGAVALGHPVGASGTRIILTLLLELKARKKKLGIATLCVGGGQGEAVLVEAAL